MRRAGPMPLPMIARDREQAELRADLDAAAAGRGRAAIILGEPGMGKSMLTDWLADQATASGFRVLRGVCSAAAMLPLWPWRLLLREVDTGDRMPWLAPAGAALSASDRELAAATIVDAVARTAAARPLLLVVEDVHWSDAASALVARLLADAAATLPMLLVLTARDDPAETAEEPRALIAGLSTGVRRLRLPALDLAGVARLATDTLGAPLSDAAVRELAARTGGNPFFVHEVTRLLAAHGPDAAMVVPPGVREVLQRRIARLSHPCATLVTIAALDAVTTADGIDLAVVRAVSGLDDAGAAGTLDEAVGAGLLDIDRTAVWPYRFRHALIREVLASGLPQAEEGRLHALLATAIEGRGGDPPSAARLAHHWSLAIGPEAAVSSVRWSLQAARDAVAGYGFEAAINHYRRVLAETSANRLPGPEVDPVSVAIEFGEALQLAGEEVSGRDVLVAAARDAAADGRAVRLAQAALALGGGLAGFEVPTWDERQAELLRLADADLPAEEVALRAAVRGRLSLALAGRAPLSERVRLAEDAVRLTADCDDPQVEAAVLAAYCDAISGPDFVAERLAAAERIRALAVERLPATLHRDTTVLLAHRLLLLGHLELGELGAAEEQMAEYERLAHRLGVRRYLWWPEIWRGMRALLDGRPERALEHAEAAEEIGRHGYNADMMGFTLRLEAHRDRGTLPMYAEVITGLLTRMGHTAMPAMYYAAPARALLATGDADLARRVLRTFLTGDENARPKDAEWLECHWAMVDCALALDHRAAAAALYAELQPYEALWAVDGIGAVVFGNLAEQLGRLAGYLGDAADAQRYLVRARERYEAADTRSLLARVDQALVDQAGGDQARVDQAGGDQAGGDQSRGGPRPAATGREPALTGWLRRDGSVWLLEWRGRRSTLPDAKGLHDLAILLAHPGHAVPAVELVRAESGMPAVATGGDLGPMLDESATRAYRRRVNELDQEISEADADADLGRTEQLRAERAALIEELTAAFGLGGRPRRVGDPAERARKTVTMRIRSAIRSIGERDEALARHLSNAVRTGRLCSYEPEETVDWRSSPT